MTKIDQDELLLSCLRFVLFKDAVDAHMTTQDVLNTNTITEKTTPWFPDNKLALERWSADPAIFVRLTLPFSDPMYDYRTMHVEEVDPRLIVSGTYSAYDICDPNTVMDWSDRLATEETKYDSDSPRVARIGELPLYVALEGKNRVELFKRFRRRMRVLVTDTEYPAAEHLQILKVRPSGLHALCHENEFVMLPFETVTLKLLTAYGVPYEARPVWWWRASGSWHRKRNRVLGPGSRMLL